MRKHAALNPDELGTYNCKRHGEVEPIVSLRSNGYYHRRCPTCLKEHFDKAQWQRDRRALAKKGQGPKGRSYIPKAVSLEDLPQYSCKRHGDVEPLVTKTSDGRIARRCSTCWGASDDEFSLAWRAKKAAYMREWNQQVMLECFAAYGGVCACCKESNPTFLSIDHVHGDGALHRKTISGGKNIYRWLRVRGYPKDGYQLLCFSCNLGRQRNGGICPHVQPPMGAAPVFSGSG